MKMTIAPTITAVLVCKQSGTTATPYSFSVTLAQQPTIIIAGSVILSSPIVPLGVIHHLVYRTDGVNAKIFLNGVQANTAAYAPAMATTADAVTLGNNIALSRQFNGTIYTVRMYNRALTDAEILQNYSADKNNS